MKYGTVTVWVEDEDEVVVSDRVEKILDAINETDVPCSVSEDVGDYEAA